MLSNAKIKITAFIMPTKAHITLLRVVRELTALPIVHKASTEAIYVEIIFAKYNIFIILSLCFACIQSLYEYLLCK